MLMIETPEQKLWPQAPIGTGDFDWKRVGFMTRIPDNATSVQLCLGLEEVTGNVWFDDLKTDGGQITRAARGPAAPDRL